ncbi:FAD-dependent oxidoreductase [Fulvimarina endophytica]|uniref:FAD-dependent oxidoreductase n=1 Tax=Fulvimarina endophytica TaxID=2293836 RepID=UPI00247AD215|nr:FAD-dependent oxidoreductase [Fulvimarina endophytica]
MGAGHAHVEVLRALAERPEPGIALTLVTPHERTPYSGSLPGYLAGFYTASQMTIDAKGLARRAGARLHLERAVGLDPDVCRLETESGERLDYDLLSLDIGSLPGRGAGEPGIPVKPIDRFTETVDRILADARSGNGPFRLAVVGTGAAGVELAFAFLTRLPRELGGRQFEILLIGEEEEILSDRSPRTRVRLTRTLRSKGIEPVIGSRVERAEAGRLILANGREIVADTIVWAVTSRAPSWLERTGLSLDAGGFVEVDKALRSLSHPNVFAAGDVASLPDPRPKAGVFAVREGPILARNLRAAALGGSLRSFRPQSDWLNLLSTGDGRAVADKWGISLEGAWVWRWKDWNDRRFVERYNRFAGSSAERNRSGRV